MKSKDFLLQQKASKIYDGKYVEIYDLSHIVQGLAFAYWRGFLQLSQPECLNDMEMSITCVKNNGIKVYISDCSDLHVVTQDVLNWWKQRWYPENGRNGMISEIIINSTHLFGQLGLDKLIRERKIGEVLVLGAPDIAESVDLGREVLLYEEVKEC